MKSLRLRAVLLLGSAAASAAFAAPALENPFLANQLLREARTFHIEVEQTYLNTTDLIALPFAEAATALLQQAGLTAEVEGMADVHIRIRAEGRALARKYADQRQTETVQHYSGAVLTGWCEIAASSDKIARINFSGRREPPANITQAYDDPGSAPYLAAFGGYVESFTRTVAGAFGAKPLIGVLRAPDTEEFFYTVPQLQWCAAAELARTNNPEAKTVLIEALQSFSPHRQAGGARGLGLLGDASALPQLLGALSTVEGEVPVDFATDLRWQTITHAERAFDPVESEAGFIEPWPEIINAIAKIQSPGKTSMMAALLRGQDSVLARVGLALLLGKAKDARGYETLLSVAQSDENVLVRAAAINALGELGDPRAVTELRTLAASAAAEPEKLATKRALDRFPADATAPGALAENAAAN